ncbi:hypothetical protein FRACYDRAFT_264653 [Fragilariopsis cylindrus CCMP1102]|uniref:Uncharacterized protein n=1 Tax=Fragilariopsis cylindrus CCMP1102 TaxID=635003 RepID=A0A1E7EQW7_9STRA|nr:hypothetical protein FRACYDRAFT_264653 [Fragilariopsis cylindrus CCMP1102]|eukprot:OEU08206.1 hypothetical protein FRACYDRAFT_264653 [Fragilariopsis cylindrus CCMP1102]
MKLSFLLVSSLAYYVNASSSDGVVEHYSLLRGSSQEQDQEQEQHQEQQGLASRSLQLDLNEMECKADTISADGSIICSFRMYPPPTDTDPAIGSTIKHHACAYVPAPFSASMCLSAEVNRVNFNDLPEDHFTNNNGNNGVVTMPVEPVIPPTLPSSTPCVGNGIGQTCYTSENPNIACCSSMRTGAAFNACCSSDFGVLGILTDTTIDGGGASCRVTGSGCPTTNVPGNEVNQELDFSNISGGPCKKVSDDPTCSNQQNDPTKNYGTCTNNGVTFDVCCPANATGTYAVGDSCTVTVPGRLPPSTMPVEPVVMPGDDSTPDTVFIDADVSNVVIPPPKVTPSQSVAPPLPGRSDCPPTKPQELSDCSELKKSGYGSVRCSYYDNIVDPQAGGITNCDCVRDQGFRCRQATAFTFSF